MPDLAAEAKAALRRLDVAPQRRRGQNFMVREDTLDAVAGALEIAPGEAVLEIGPGLGFLTRRLVAAGAKVTAVEKDRVMARHLRAMFPPGSLELIEKDFLDLDPERDLGPDPPRKIVGNIPYNITSPILEWVIRHRARLSAVALTTQWEVAQRLAASPGGKDWGALSVFVQFHCEVRVLRKIGREAFYPVPGVDSALIRLDLLPAPRHAPGDEGLFFRLVRAAFQKRRKTLLNALAAPEGRDCLSKSRLLEVFAATRIDPRRRPETLSLAEWASLSDSLSK